ncbi:MAG TPA: flagellar biosynthetic protein FliO [Caulobacteraceae bacterium]
MFLAVLQTMFGLVVTLGLVGLAAYAARRWGPTGMFQVRPAGERRLAILESLTLDPSRRLVLIRLDDEERLVLLGEGRLLDHTGPLRTRPAALPNPSSGLAPRGKV